MPSMMINRVLFYSDVSPQPWPWSVLKDLFEVLGLGFDDEVSSWP